MARPNDVAAAVSLTLNDIQLNVNDKAAAAVSLTLNDIQLNVNDKAE